MKEYSAETIKQLRIEKFDFEIRRLVTERARLISNVNGVSARIADLIIQKEKIEG